MFPDYPYPSLSIDQIKSDLNQSGACLVRGLPMKSGNPDLKGLVRALGSPLLESRNIDGGMVFSVCVDTTSDLPAYAQTPFAFDCHTDCSEFAVPPQLLFLLCEEAAQDGGESLWACLDDIVSELSYTTLLQLQKPIFCFRGEMHPILTLNPVTDRVNVRYNKVSLAVTQECDMVWSHSVQMAIDEFDSAIVKHSKSLLLEKGDCFIMDNHCGLHGRKPFTPPRILKRVRAFSPDQVQQSSESC